MAIAPVNNDDNNWIPNLAGRLDPQAEQAVQYLFRAVYSLRNGTGISPAGITTIVKQASPQIIQVTNPAASAALSASGSHPLNIQNLPGQAPTPVSTPIVTALPGPNDPLSVVGQAIIFEGVQWVYTSLPGVSSQPFWFRSAAIGTTLQDTHANRVANFPASSYPVGTNFYETDTTITYQVQNIGGSNVWLYVNGVFRDVLANIPVGLGVDDFGYWFKATDYFHDYNWDGTAWHFATADPGSDFLTESLNPAGPNGGLWGKSDGSTYAVAQDNGTTSNVTTSVLANFWLRR